MDHSVHLGGYLGFRGLNQAQEMGNDTLFGAASGSQGLGQDRKAALTSTLTSSTDRFLTQRLEVESLITDEVEGFICNVFCSS